MKTLYLECNMGAAGDMLSAALFELIKNKEDFIRRVNSVGIPHVEIIFENSVKCGIVGTHMKVLAGGAEEGEHTHEHEHEHHHHHTGLHDIEHIVGHLKISDKVKKDVLSVYRLIAEAESKAHGCAVEQIHFHELGTLDAVADITSVCMLIEELAPDKITASPIHVGCGQVKCAHGILPVPAPATASILSGTPIYGGSVSGELCTPTGAALLKYFASEFSSMPIMKTEKIGYGLGTKDFECANVLRAFIGETDAESSEAVELLCNLDDMTGEQVSLATERLFEAGALDVFTVPVGMKKGRPGVLLVCLCEKRQRDDMLKTIFRHTSTIGVREHIVRRYVLDREEITVNTKYGEIRAKKSCGYGSEKVKPEYEDLRKIATENNISIFDIF